MLFQVGIAGGAHRPNGNRHIFVIGIDGTGLTNLSEISAGVDVFDSTPVWVRE
ncbi:MAG: hypothetical protein O2992_06795 [Gemmatimonadetes bacterium]|nr:hypothetical protein [Gemmatimonadota bacterium]